MLSLFDSIRKQYPIGTLLFWESHTARPSQDYLGPLVLPPASSPVLVLDGQQRLTTLAGVLLRGEMDVRNDERDAGRWDIYYDAEADDFSYFEKSHPVSAVPITQLMGTRGLYSAATAIFESGVVDNQTADLWIQRMEGVSASLTAYRIPLVVFATDSLRLAVESFTRLNRSGQPMGADEMFSALTYEADDRGEEVFRLSDFIDAMLKSLVRKHFGEVDRVNILRIVLLAAGFDPFRTEWDRLARSSDGDMRKRLTAALKEASRGLSRAVRFLSDEGIRNNRLLPYGMQLVGLAAFFGRAPSVVSDAQLALLRRWLWVTSFTEGFGGLNSSRVLIQLQFLRDELPGLSNPKEFDGIDLDAEAHPFPARHDHRSARVRALLCVMAKTSALRKDRKELTPRMLGRNILERGPEAMVRICRRSAGVDSALLSSPANRMFDVLGNDETLARRWIVELNPVDDPDILESIFVNSKAWSALAIDGDDRQFIRLREQTLMDLEIEFMERVGVTPYSKRKATLSAIDVEDAVPLSDAAPVVDLPGWDAA